VALASKERVKVIEFAEQHGVIKFSDVKHLGLSASYLADLADSGVLERVERGIYTLPGSSVRSFHHSKVEVAARCPQGVVCLLSALAFHEIGTQLPPAIWLGIPTKGWAPKIDSVMVEIVRMKPELLTVGVDEHCIEGVSVRITSPARTVVDCFRYRSRVGTDVAIEALRETLNRRIITSDELYEFATLERVWSVIEPYAQVIG
jgi:predicted transcriptional regulator of viral defense system